MGWLFQEFLHRCQTACKPGSVRTRRPFRTAAHGTTIPLGHASQRASRDQPGRRDEISLACACHPYSVLLPVGFTLPPPLPEARCALTAPFHPCLRQDQPNGVGLSAGGLFSVALSLGSPPPDVIRHRYPVEPGLSSGTHAHRRPPGRLTGGSMRHGKRAVNRRQAIASSTTPAEISAKAPICIAPIGSAKAKWPIAAAAT